MWSHQSMDLKKITTAMWNECRNDTEIYLFNYMAGGIVTWNLAKKFQENYIRSLEK